ncbi:MAG: zinc transporter ZntB, partial [Deltaproteobacteria bacterium]|nr:zinc transporter ZntB [Deltaproteobacteria bacterium]
MNTENALIFGYLLDGKGGGNALDWDAIDAWTPDKGLLWVHLDSTVAESSSWLMKKSGIDPLICESLLEQESRPRNILTNDGLLLILRGVNSNPNSEPEDMVAIRMLVSEQRIISMRYRKIMAMQDMHQNIETGTGPRSAGEFLVMVAERIADRMGDVISEIDDNVDELEDAVLTAESRDLRTQLADLRRATIGLRRYIAPQRD